MIIAIDGPAASGKGSIAARLASHYGLPHLDTGLLYRAVGSKVLDLPDGPEFAEQATAMARQADLSNLDATLLGTAEIGQAASRVAAIPAVREALFRFQVDFAHQPGGAVLDGRDIGTVICPDADVKIFVTASIEARAGRRAAQLRAAGFEISDDEMQADLAARDARDGGRADAPMKAAADAHLLDTSEMDIEAAFRAALDIAETAMTGKTGRGDGLS